MTDEEKFPEVAFSTSPVADFGWHDCVEFGGDSHIADAFIHYRRYGWEHGMNVCGLCLRGELMLLHAGNPQPTFVRVTTAVAENGAAA